MALTRKLLEGMGLTDEQVDTIIEAHTDTVDGLKSGDILAATKSDKKMEQGTIKFILLESVGHAVVDRTVTDEEMLEAINSINGDLIDEE